MRYLGVVVGVVVTVVAVVVIALSPHAGRADPTAHYRPPVPPDALTNGCYPLPQGLRLDFPYQVRQDGPDPADAGKRRLVVQYDEIGDRHVRELLDGALAHAGLPSSSAVVTPLPGRADDSIVRGTIVLTLPAVANQRPSDPVCSDPASTKRQPQSEAAS